MKEQGKINKLAISDSCNVYCGDVWVWTKCKARRLVCQNGTPKRKRAIVLGSWESVCQFGRGTFRELGPKVTRRSVCRKLFP